LAPEGILLVFAVALVPSQPLLFVFEFDVVAKTY